VRNSSWLKRAIGVAACLVVTGCAGSKLDSVPVGEAAYKIVPPADPAAPQEAYVIAANDLLDLRIFQEPDLSNDKLQVDDTGRIQMPLIGEVNAAGRTASELASEISARLRERYVVNPQVVVSVVKTAVQFVTVEGQVIKPGVYEITRNYTLLSAIARAESPNKTAKLDEIMILRNVDNQRMVARFDLGQIRTGKAPDPKILGGDVIVVGYSQSKGFWQNLLQAAPLLNIFYLLRV
jgi:polysaccharide export outer membrane protein